MISCEDTLHDECMGWCPCEQQMGGKMAKRPITGMDDAAGKRNPVFLADFSWWNCYHNQLLVIALLASVVSLALLSLVGGPPAFVWVSIAIGVAIAMIAFAAHFSTWYADIAAGKWRREAVSKIKRLFRCLSGPVFTLIAIIYLGWLIHLGVFDIMGGPFAIIGGIFFAGALINWFAYTMTVRWERQHRLVLIKKWGSWDAVNPAMTDDI